MGEDTISQTENVTVHHKDVTLCQKDDDIVIRPLQSTDDIPLIQRITIEAVWEARHPFRQLFMSHPTAWMLMLVMTCIIFATTMFTMSTTSSSSAVISSVVESSFAASAVMPLLLHHVPLFSYIISNSSQLNKTTQVTPDNNQQTNTRHSVFEPAEENLISSIAVLVVSALMSYSIVLLITHLQVSQFVSLYQSTMTDMLDPVRYYDSAQHPGRAFWLAESTADGSIVGTVAMDTTTDGLDTRELRRMAVSHNHRRRNIGTKLLRTVEKSAVEQGCTKIQLSNTEVHYSAHKFYSSDGYSLIRVEEMDYTMRCANTKPKICHFEKLISK